MKAALLSAPIFLATAFSAVATDPWRVEQIASRLTNFSGVAGSSKENVFAVGNRGAIFRFDGSGWTRQKSPTERNLTDVWADRRQRAFAVGFDGVILSYDGREWKAKKSGTAKTLLKVWGSSASDVFAVGRDGTILHFDGGSWTPETSGTGVDLTAVWGSSPTNVHAAGGHGTLLHYDGTRWSQPTPSFGWHWTFTALGGTSADHVWVAGWESPSGELRGERGGVLLRYDGKAWEPVRGGDMQIVQNIWAVSQDEVVLVGPALNGLEQIRFYNGAALRDLDQENPPQIWAARSEGRFAPRAVWGSFTGELFVVGTNGFVLRVASNPLGGNY